MTSLFGILGVAGLFALFGYVATRHGTRLEEGEGCHGDSCILEGGCEGCCSGEAAGSAGWWSDRK